MGEETAAEIEQLRSLVERYEIALWSIGHARKGAKSCLRLKARKALAGRRKPQLIAVLEHKLKEAEAKLGASANDVEIV